MRSMIRRMEKLEARLLPVPRPPLSEEDLRSNDAVNRLLERLEPERRSLVLEDMEGCSKRGKIGKLTSMVLHYAELHLKGGTPLEFPSSVASVYLQNPDARPYHECADCGYDLPVESPYPGATPAKVYFESCPLCGGQVGRYAFYFKHGYFKTHRPDPGAPPSEAGVNPGET